MLGSEPERGALVAVVVLAREVELRRSRSGLMIAADATHCSRELCAYDREGIGDAIGAASQAFSRYADRGQASLCAAFAGLAGTKPREVRDALNVILHSGSKHLKNT
jgi:hypothetical protein